MTLAHEKVGHTDQGLWHHEGWQLPAYIQHVANDLIESGHSESHAIELAVGIIKNWAHGHDGRGHSVSAETQAKAVAALAEWEALKAAANKSRRNLGATMADSKKPYGDVTYADPGYQKDGKKRYPIDTEAHVRAAWSYINKADNASAYSSEQVASIKGRIRSAAKKFGIQISDNSSSSGRSEYGMDVERRYTPGTVEVRMGSEGRPKRIGGYAAKFG